MPGVRGLRREGEPWNAPDGRALRQLPDFDKLVRGHVREDLPRPARGPRDLDRGHACALAEADVLREGRGAERASARHLSVAKPAARPDYGWLAQALWANVDQRKRYPAEAKRNRWEGKVVLRLTIEQRGSSVHLLDLTLEESSGHAVLDRHTQEMVRNAFPLEVKHALSQPRIQLHVPFSYSMQ